MYTKKIYFSGGDFNELKKIFAELRGVLSVTFGTICAENVISYANPAPRNVENIFGVEVEFNPKKNDISTLMDELFGKVNPYQENNAGVYYTMGEDAPQIELHMNFIANRGKELAASNAALTLNDTIFNTKRARKCYAAFGRLTKFDSLNFSQNCF